MNELLLYLYGMITGLLFAVVIMYFGHLISKAIYHGFAGSAPTLKNTINQGVKRGKLPY
jgi:hypothetical protein